MRTDHAFICDLREAKDVCLRRLAQQRTRVRMLLYDAVGDLLADAVRLDQQETRRRIASALKAVR